jgi:DNA-binding transcriptional MerR regulator
MNQAYRVQRFAEVAGVTVRALHHYDRIGLLRPQRSQSGYRMYALRDLERLEQIVALKFLGIPLKQIKPLLERDARKLSTVLRAQRAALEEKRRRLDQAITALQDAEQAPDSSALKKIIEVIEMQDNAESMKKYYTEEAWAKLAERREKAFKDPNGWDNLFKDVEASLAEDPASPKAQALLRRWDALIGEFTGGDPNIVAGLRKAWADKENWPASVQKQALPHNYPQVFEYIAKVRAAG